MNQKTRKKIRISNQRFNNLIELMTKLEKEIDRCKSAKAYLAGCVMVGAALEASLLSMVAIYRNEVKPVLPKKKLKESEMLKWGLHDLLQISFEAGWLPYAKTSNPNKGEIGDWLLNYVKGLRNLVHPGRCIKEFRELSIRKKHFDFSVELFKLAKDHLLNKVENNILKTLSKKRDKEV